MSHERERPIIIRKKRAAHHGHHGGAWKVAFADFTTSMMALFLVLWIVTQSSDIKSAIAGYFQDPLGFASEFGSSFMPGEGAQTQSVRMLRYREIMDLRRDRLAIAQQRILEHMEEVPRFEEMSDFIEIAMSEEGMRIELLEDRDGMFFESGSATPQRRGREVLSVLGQELGQMPNGIVIEGHTDATPYAVPGRYSNWELSTERANMARRILMLAGVRPDQVQEIRGYADRHPRLPDRPFEPGNRRVTITVLIDRSTELTAADSAAGIVIP